MALINKQPKLSCHMASMTINNRRLIKPVMLICFCSAKFLKTGFGPKKDHFKKNMQGDLKHSVQELTHISIECKNILFCTEPRKTTFSFFYRKENLNEQIRMDTRNIFKRRYTAK